LTNVGDRHDPFAVMNARAYTRGEADVCRVFVLSLLLKLEVDPDWRFNLVADSCYEGLTLSTTFYRGLRIHVVCVKC